MGILIGTFLIVTVVMLPAESSSDDCLFDLNFSFHIRARFQSNDSSKFIFHENVLDVVFSGNWFSFIFLLSYGK